MGFQVVGKNGSNHRRVLAAVYSRVSTINGGQDSTMQTRELVEYCQRRGWEIFDCYVDNGVSGKKDSRPELNRLMADAHARRFDVVVCWRFDRFSRSVSHLCRALETFHALKIDFCSMIEQVPADRIVTATRAASAAGVCPSPRPQPISPSRCQSGSVRIPTETIGWMLQIRGSPCTSRASAMASLCRTAPAAPCAFAVHA